MATYGHPGSYVSELLVEEPTGANNAASTVVFVAAANRGPTVPTKFSSTQDVRRTLGDFTGVEVNDRLLQACYDAYNNGAQTIYINRIAGTSAAPATVTLKLSTGTTPPSALTFTATNPGIWGNQLYLQVNPGYTSDRFTITTRLVPLGAAITNAQIVDQINDLSLNPLDPRYVLNVFNSLGLPNAYVSAALFAGYVYTPGDVIATSSLQPGGDKLSAGSDGTRDGGTLDAAARHDAVYALDTLTSPFVLNLPGVTDATSVNMLAAYADSSLSRTDGLPGRGDVFVVVDGDPATPASTMVSKVATYTKSDVVAVYYPWLVIPDPVNAGTGATKLIPAGPSVVGRFIATDTVKGPFKSPAGVADGRINGAFMTDPAVPLRSPDLDALNGGNINAIKPVPGYGSTVIFGSRTLKSDYVTRYVSARRTLIYARVSLLQATAFAPFENNDSTLWSHLTSVATTFCNQLLAAGGLKGPAAAQAFYVLCNSSNNTNATVAAGEVHLEVGLAVQRPAEFVVIQIGQFLSGTGVTEIPAR